jgi:hypothetical protein
MAVFTERANGANEIRRVAEACRRLGTDRTIVNQMSREIRKQAGPVVRQAVRENARALLPKRGGLNEWVARASIRIAVLRGADTAGVTVRVGRNSQTGRADLKGLDAGTVRHPTFGNRKRWATTSVSEGVISDAITEEGADVVEQAVLDAAQRAIEKILFS